MEITKANILNALHSTATEHVVAVTDDIYDENLLKYLSEINTEILDNIPTKTSELENDSNFAYVNDLSNVLAEEIVDETTFPEILNLTRELIKKDLFIDLWNAACGLYGGYNKETGYFELNGLTDITYEEAHKIYATGTITSTECSHRYRGLKKIRTNLPPEVGGITFRSSSINGSMLYIVTYSDIEVLNLKCYSDYFTPLANNTRRGTDAIFINCPKLREVIGTIDVGDFRNSSNKSCDKYIVRGNCDELRKLKLDSLYSNIDLTAAPKLDVESVQFMIYNSLPSKIPQNYPIIPITITVHPDMYAKLIDENNIEWHKIFTYAESLDIHFVEPTDTLDLNPNNEEIYYE